MKFSQYLKEYVLGEEMAELVIILFFYPDYFSRIFDFVFLDCRVFGGLRVCG